VSIWFLIGDSVKELCGGFYHGGTESTEGEAEREWFLGCEFLVFNR